jgi:hypothetical protein
MKPVYYDWISYANYGNMFGIKKNCKTQIFVYCSRGHNSFSNKMLYVVVIYQKNVSDVFSIIQTQLSNNHSSFNEGLSWLLVLIGRAHLCLCHHDMSYCFLTSVLSNTDSIFIFFIVSVLFYPSIHIIHLLKSVSASIILVFYIRIVNFSNSLFTYWSSVILVSRLI